MPNFDWKQETIDGELFDIGISTDYSLGQIILKGHFTNAEKTKFNGTMNYTYKLIKYEGLFLKNNGYWVPHGFCKKTKLLKKPCITYDSKGLETNPNEWIKYEGEWYMGKKGVFDSDYYNGKKYIYRVINHKTTQVQIKCSYRDLLKHGVFQSISEDVPYCKIYSCGQCMYDQEKDYGSKYQYKHLNPDDIQEIMLNIMFKMSMDLAYIPKECDTCKKPIDINE